MKEKVCSPSETPVSACLSTQGPVVFSNQDISIGSPLASDTVILHVGVGAIPEDSFDGNGDDPTGGVFPKVVK